MKRLFDRVVHVLSVLYVHLKRVAEWHPEIDQ
jgi:hypothetical protein